MNQQTSKRKSQLFDQHIEVPEDPPTPMQGCCHAGNHIIQTVLDDCTFVYLMHLYAISGRMATVVQRRNIPRQRLTVFVDVTFLWFVCLS